MKRTILTLCFLLFTAPVWATSYYVTTGGSDGADGSVGTPWASLSHACGAVSGVGDIINLAAGAYTDNSVCTLAVGVKIAGASSATTTITTSASPYYIEATSAVPVVDGSNEISGLGLTGTNYGIRSRGRNNQKIHDNTFTNFIIWLHVAGKDPVNNGSCVGGETTATYCDGTAAQQAGTVPPATTDWATGVEVYNNTATNSRLEPDTITGALIHDNTINNAGADRSGVGNTSYFWSGVQFYNNTLHMFRNNSTVIAMEVWEISGDTKFYNNVSDGWWSLEKNHGGGATPYMFEVTGNDFSSNITKANVGFALEIAWTDVHVLIAGNYFANTGGNATYNTAITIGGGDVVNDIMIRNNVFYNLTGAVVDIISTHASHSANIDNIYVYNNAIENAAGAGSFVLFENDNAGGDIDGVFVRNNLIRNLNYAIDFSPFPCSSLSGNFYDHNNLFASTDHVRTARDCGSFTTANNTTLNPGLNASGSRWTNWYKPSSAVSNMLNIGVNVGLPFFGGVPDIGPFDWTVPSFGGTTASNVLSSTSGSFSHTVSGTHPLLLVLVSKRTGNAGNPSIATLTYNGVAMTKGPFVLNGDQYGTDIWYLVNPATGSNTVAWTAADNTYTIFEAVNIVDTDTTIPLRGAGVCATGNTTTPTVDIASATTDLVVDAVVKAATTGTLAQGAGQGLIADITGTSHIRGGASLEIGAATTTMSWTITSAFWAVCTASIRPYVAASGLHHHPIVMQ